ncbi:hypothetical protein LQZ18_11380 [Lachnospiraceae bacterium ZAX-1]
MIGSIYEVKEMELTEKILEQMQSVPIMEVEIGTLTDLNDIHIDTAKPVHQKLAQFAAQTDNVFLNRVGEYVVKVSYADTGQTVNDKMKGYLKRLAEIKY